MRIKSKLKSKKVKPQIKNLKFLILVLPFTFYLFTFNCFAQSISSVDLINNAKQYDGKAVTYSGEVIGEVMARGDFAWLNVNDGQNAIGVWAPKVLIADIKYTGSYKSKGDVIEAAGIFQRACPQHGGDLDIHAISIKKVDAGRDIFEKLNPAKRNQALILFGILCTVWIFSLFKHR